MNEYITISAQGFVLRVDKNTLRWSVLKEGSNEYCDLIEEKCLVAILKVLELDPDDFYNLLENSLAEKAYQKTLANLFH